jgi:hypothetical protein
MISIILVNWNGREWLGKCLSSLQKQTYKNIEIILVDNASTDGSIDFIEKNFSKVKVIKNTKNLGFSHGNNIGISKAKGERILLINNDTWVEKDFLEKLSSFYKENNYDVVAPREAKYDGKKQKPFVTTIDPLGHYVHLSCDKKNNKQSFYLTGVCLLFSKQLYIETGGFDNNFFMYCEEVDWFWRLNLLKKRFNYADNVYVYHAGAGSTGLGIKYNTFLWRNQNTLQMLLKNYSLLNLLWISPLYLLQNLFEIIFFVLILKFNISRTYISGWLYVFKHFNEIITERREIQKKRLLSDFEVMKKMYLGFGKLAHFKKYFLAKNTK